ncbi:hypothetical protein Tco_0775333 [Tanacetum coccineum]
MATNQSRLKDNEFKDLGPFGRHSVEIHVIWAQFGKKTDKVANEYEDEDSRPGSGDAVGIFPTASGLK